MKQLARFEANLLRIVHGKGETVREGTVIAYVGAPGEDVDKG